MKVLPQMRVNYAALTDNLPGLVAGKPNAIACALRATAACCAREDQRKQKPVRNGCGGARKKNFIFVYVVAFLWMKNSTFPRKSPTLCLK